MTTDTINHLGILIQREMAERINETPENLIGRALNIAEYIVMHGAPDAIEEEMIAAARILEVRGLSYLLEVSAEDFPAYAVMVREKVGPKHAFCIKCGRALKNKNALKVGMGITCKAQIKKGNWEIDRTNKSSTDTRRQEIAENDALEMDNPERLGLRRIALKYEISVSSVRIDRQVNRRKGELASMAGNLIENGEMPVEADYYPTIPEPLIPPPPKPKKEKKPEETDEPEEHGPFDPENPCKIYKRKGDGSHCKKKCKRSRPPEPEEEPEEPTQPDSVEDPENPGEPSEPGEVTDQVQPEEEEDIFGDGE